jgi:hypothetical protein
LSLLVTGVAAVIARRNHLQEVRHLHIHTVSESVVSDGTAVAEPVTAKQEEKEA